MSRIVWSDSALADFEKVIAYIADRDVDAALRVASVIEKTVNALALRSTGRPGRVGGTLEKSVPRYPYVIAYLRDDVGGGDARTVVLRVIHTSRNWPKGAWPEE